MKGYANYIKICPQQKDKEKKMTWIAWDKLCILKEKGGIGFRDLRAFNLALLTKQGWRIQQNPNSLVHRVFKVRYFADRPFMEAVLGRRPLYVWRSILAAVEDLSRDKTTKG